MLRFLTGALAALILALPAAAQPVDTGHLVAELVPATQGVAPGQTVQVALRQQIDKGWHTYWRNPGDAGGPTQIKWMLPPGWTAGGFVWPAPQRLLVKSADIALMNYGFKDEVILPMTLTAPADAPVGRSVTLRAAASFLVCAEICVPEDAVLTLVMPVTVAPAPPDPRWGPVIEKALAEAPKPAGLTAAFQPTGETVTLAVTGPPLAGAEASGAYFFPYESTLLDHARPQAIERGPQGLTLTLPAGYGFQAGRTAPVLAGVLSLGPGQAWEVTASPGPPPPGASGLGAPGPAPPADGLGIALAVLYALLGGLILNLMPCVFPVLAMKAASLAGHAHDRSEARAQGLAFGAGVLATFLVLAGLLIALKAAGAAVGWGFQLQSPPVVAALSLLMLAVALNLSGVFEVGGSLQGLGSRMAGRAGLAGAFFTGALAVVVAAPCTAPFMAPALGWALVQPPLAGLAVFAALGVGFAAPFVAVALVPGLLDRLPRPGGWMETFRRVLAFPMYGTAAWLAWVLAAQAGSMGLARLLAAAVLLAFGAWLAGHAQGRQARGHRALTPAVGAGAAIALAAALALWPGYAAPASAASSARTLVPSEPYSPERLAALRAEGRPVFVDYTAAWCVTCKVNEAAALNRAAVAATFRTTNAAYLVADWTLRDAVIAADLAKFGRAGVPLYLVYPATGEPAVLPQVLTEGIVIRAVEAAAKRG